MKGELRLFIQYERKVNTTFRNEIRKVLLNLTEMLLQLQTNDDELCLLILSTAIMRFSEQS